MAFRTWAKLLAATVGAAALAGASQLGVAYGLGILRLTRVLDLAIRDQWTAQLAWVAWFAMMAAVLGGLAGGRLLDRWGAPATAGTQIGLAAAAGVGAALVVPLTMQPARTAQIAGVHPVFVIGFCAALGALVGTFAAYAALTQIVARWSLSLVGAIIWVIAIVSVAPSLAPSDPLPAVRLGVFDAGFLSPAVTQRTALFTMPALALLVGATLGWAARRREMPTLVIALAGLPGPALLTLSYLIAGPGSGNQHYQVVPYWAAMTATGAGVLGSVLSAVFHRGDLPEDEDDADAGSGPHSRNEFAAAPKSPSEAGAHDDESGSPTARIPDQRLASDRPTSDRPTSDRPTSDRPTSDRPASGPPRASGLPADSSVPPDGRRSRAAEAFTTRSAGWPLRRPDQHNNGGTDPSGHTGVTVGEYAREEPKPFDTVTHPHTGSRAAQAPTDTATGAAQARPDSGSRTPQAWPDTAAGTAQARPDTGSRDAGRSGGWAGLLGRDTHERAGAQHAAFEPFAPAPAIPAMPPEAIQQPPRNTDTGLLGRARMAFSRNRSRAKEVPTHADPPPAVPEPAHSADAPAPTRHDLPPAQRPAAPGTAPTPPGTAPTWPGRNPLPGEPSPRRQTPADRCPPTPNSRADEWQPGRAPLFPEPHAVSAPLPHPDPVTPPFPAVPDPISPPPGVTPTSQPDTRRGWGRKRRHDDDFVDWVSGLGGPQGDQPTDR